MSNVFIQARNIWKSYEQGTSELSILKGIDLDIQMRESLCILGASGAGKSTLLHILGTLDRPSKGELFFDGKNLLSMSEEDLAKFRNSTMGFVFQFHHLMAEFTALENVMIPCRLAGQNRSEAEDRSSKLLNELGLSDRVRHYPSQLSGGELQRVAIARALVRNPKILFADEPTGNLDSQNSLKIQNLFFELKERHGLTVVVVTHDLQFAQKFSRVLRLKDGVWSSS
jgi:lipoprotein-releasing system ATP-binding protein